MRQIIAFLFITICAIGAVAQDDIPSGIVCDVADNGIITTKSEYIITDDKQPDLSQFRIKERNRLSVNGTTYTIDIMERTLGAEFPYDHLQIYKNDTLIIAQDFPGIPTTDKAERRPCDDNTDFYTAYRYTPHEVLLYFEGWYFGTGQEHMLVLLTEADAKIILKRDLVRYKIDHGDQGAFSIMFLSGDIFAQGFIFHPTLYRIWNEDGKLHIKNHGRL